MITELLIKTLDQSGKNEFLFTDLLIKHSPHSPSIQIHKVYKEEVGGQWNVVFGNQREHWLIKEVTNKETLGTIYQRVMLLNIENKPIP